MWLISWPVSSHLDRFWFGEIDHRSHYIFGQINKNRAWSSGPGYVKSLPDCINQLLGVSDQIVVLCTNHRSVDVRIVMQVVTTEAELELFVGLHIIFNFDKLF